MEIRKKIALLFIALVALIILISSIAIYISFSETRKEEFFDRLSSKAKLVAQMLIDIDEIDRGLLRKIERNNPLALPMEKIKIFDSANDLIYISDTANSIDYPLDLINEVRSENEIRFKKNNFEIVGHYYSGQNDKIVVFVAARDIFGLQKLQRLGIILIIVFFSSLVIVSITGRIFSDRALKPISNLINEIDGIETSNLGIEINEGNGKDEISKLAKTFNNFLKRLERSVNMQRDFIANASHELRTPLTVMSGQLEVLLLKEREVDEYQKTLYSILEEIKNLTNISNRLLILAKASSEFSRQSYTRCRVDELVWKSRQELLSTNTHYNIEISFSDEVDSDDKLMVFGNEQLLKTAFYNLMDNACKYSDPHSVHIKIGSKENKYIKIFFSDKGIGIADTELKNIFQPFYRSNEVIEIKGHGIGLSLVEKIVAIHNGTIQVSSKHGEGSIFTIILPLSS